MHTMGLAISKHEAFWEACGFGHTEKVRKFIEDGMDVDWKSYQVRSEKFYFFMIFKMKCNLKAVFISHFPLS